VFDARRRGELQSVRIETQSIRARAGSSERLVADTRARLWEALRVEPEVSSASRRDGSPGLALSVQLNFAAGAATFEGLRGREGSPEDLSRAVVAEALSFIDSEATTDPRTQRELVALAVARRQGFRLRAPRSGDVEILRGVMEDLGAIVRERSAEPAVPGDPMLPVFEAEEDAGLLSLTLRPV
jgi:RNA 3'-terminal phosphate cyclase